MEENTKTIELSSLEPNGAPVEIEVGDVKLKLEITQADEASPVLTVTKI